MDCAWGAMCLLSLFRILRRQGKLFQRKIGKYSRFLGLYLTIAKDGMTESPLTTRGDANMCHQDNFHSHPYTPLK